MVKIVTFVRAPLASSYFKFKLTSLQVSTTTSSLVDHLLLFSIWRKNTYIQKKYAINYSILLTSELESCLQDGLFIVRVHSVCIACDGVLHHVFLRNLKQLINASYLTTTNLCVDTVTFATKDKISHSMPNVQSYSRFLYETKMAYCWWLHRTNLKSSC